MRIINLIFIFTVSFLDHSREHSNLHGKTFELINDRLLADPYGYYSKSAPLISHPKEYTMYEEYPNQINTFTY